MIESFSVKPFHAAEQHGKRRNSARGMRSHVMEKTPTVCPSIIGFSRY